MPVTILNTKDGVLDADDREKFNALKQRLAANRSTMLLHPHGGLVNQAGGTTAALRPAGSGAYAFNAPSDFEQVYVIWRTGIVETLKANLRDLFVNDRLYRTLSTRFLPYIMCRLRGTQNRSKAFHLTISLERRGQCHAQPSAWSGEPTSVDHSCDGSLSFGPGIISRSK
jgi:hypothetical protein